jgi:hypothetical protein
MPLRYSFKAPLWRYAGPAAWHFLTLPKDLAVEIRENTAHARGGFGSVKVLASVSGHRWSTSLFPDTESGSYLLPVKKAVRAAASIDEGDVVAAEIEVLEGA